MLPYERPAEVAEQIVRLAQPSVPSTAEESTA